ncbi:hypothetical protein [Burkholderia gladioli]|uniref:hypothetical protein n=1 Tax=Burkholderia gladioli TaxID=28095 RepID=UPI00163F6F20|nr:hypothetical protein [Burkholderia gladioli]
MNESTNPGRRSLLVGAVAATLSSAFPAAIAAISTQSTPISHETSMERPILVFDIAETILDLRALSPVF